MTGIGFENSPVVVTMQPCQPQLPAGVGHRPCGPKLRMLNSLSSQHCGLTASETPESLAMIEVGLENVGPTQLLTSVHSFPTLHSF